MEKLEIKCFKLCFNSAKKQKLRMFMCEATNFFKSMTGPGFISTSPQTAISSNINIRRCLAELFVLTSTNVSKTAKLCLHVLLSIARQSRGKEASTEKPLTLNL